MITPSQERIVKIAIAGNHSVLIIGHPLARKELHDFAYLEMYSRSYNVTSLSQADRDWDNYPTTYEMYCVVDLPISARDYLLVLRNKCQRIEISPRFAKAAFELSEDIIQAYQDVFFRVPKYPVLMERVIHVSQTIAGLDGLETVDVPSTLEAMSYCVPDIVYPRKNQSTTTHQNAVSEGDNYDRHHLSPHKH